MARKSTKENKSFYHIVREELGLTREQAIDMLPGITVDRLEKIENGRIAVLPADVVTLAAGYKRPELCNHYCTKECEIGKETVTEIRQMELGQISIETINALNRLYKSRDRLLEIVEDGKISDDELDDFNAIKSTLEKISELSDSLKMWISKEIITGNIHK